MLKGAEMIAICKTKEQDIDAVVNIFLQAKQYFKNAGINQWQTGPDGYPSKKEVQKDIQDGTAYCAMDENVVVGYACIVNLDDPNYHNIDGKWFNEEPYIVIHRSCVADDHKGQGIFSLFVQKAEELAKEKGLSNLRIDTHRDNKSMQRSIAKNGFVECGIVQVNEQSDPYRIAYQKKI